MIKSLFLAFLLIVALHKVELGLAQDRPETFKPDARSISLGGSLVTQARDLSAIFWNPAGLTALKARSVFISTNQPFEFNLASAGQFVPLYGTFAVGLSRIPNVTDDVERGTVAWGRGFGRWLAMGASFEMERFQGEWSAAASWGLLLGNPGVGSLESRWKSLSNSRLWNRLNLGVTVRNVPLTNQVFDTAALLGLSYVFPSIGLLVNTGYHVNEGGDSSHLGFGLEVTGNLALFMGVEDFDADKLGVGLDYTHDNFTFNLSYSAEFDKFFLTLNARISPAPGLLAGPHYRQGVKAVRAGNYEKASHEFKKYLAYDIMNSKTDSVRRIVYKIDRRIRQREMKVESLLVVARNYLVPSDPKFLRAALVLIRILELDPDNPEATRRLRSVKPVIDGFVKSSIEKGIHEFESNRYEKARKKFQTALMFEKEDATALYYVETIAQIQADMAAEYFYRGVGYYRQENYDRALQEFKRAIENNSSLYEADNYLSRTKAKLQERDERIAQLLQKGQGLEKKRKYIAAAEAYVEVVKLDRGNSSATSALERVRPRIDTYLGSLYNKATNYYSKGELEKARELLTRILSIDPAHEAAKKSLVGVRQKERENLSFYLANADSAFRRTEWLAALDMYDVAIEIDASNKRAIDGKKAAEQKIEIADLSKQGRRKYAQERYTEAAAIYRRILRMEPRHSSALVELERTQEELNNLVETHLNHGIDLYTRDDYQAAIRELERVLALEPDHPGAQEYIQQAKERIQALRSLK